METVRYSQWDSSPEEVPGGHWGRWEHLRRWVFSLALAILAVTVLWALILSVISSKGNATQREVRAALAEMREAQVKLMQQKSALEELSLRVTQDLATAGRDRENIRNELFRALEAAKLQNGSCGQCPTSWLPFRGSCYYFSEPRTTWQEAERNCVGNAAHLVIIGDLDEQGFLTRHTRGRGYWLGLRAVRSGGRVQGYQWVDGVSISFR